MGVVFSPAPAGALAFPASVTPSIALGGSSAVVSSVLISSGFLVLAVADNMWVLPSVSCENLEGGAFKIKLKGYPPLATCSFCMCAPASYSCP